MNISCRYVSFFSAQNVNYTNVFRVLVVCQCDIDCDVVRVTCHAARVIAVSPPSPVHHLLTSFLITRGSPASAGLRP